MIKLNRDAAPAAIAEDGSAEAPVGRSTAFGTVSLGERKVPVTNSLATPRASKAMLYGRLGAALILAVAALLLSLPMFVLGPMPAAHDTLQHINFGRYFAQQFWQGELYPRWLLNMNRGLGSPSLFVYPPLPSYVYALLLPVARVLHVDTFAAGEYLCLFVSGLCAYLWIGTIASARISLIVAVMYMLLPYHLAVDFYRRGALAECWALAWLPLVLYFTTQVVRRKRYAVAGLGIAYTLLILSHLISVLIASALPLLLVITLAERGRKIRGLITVAGGLALGVAISASYLVPALASAKYFPVSRLGYLSADSIRANLLALGVGLFTGHSGKSIFVQGVSISTIDTALFIALCGVFALVNGPRSRRRLTVLWLAVCIVPLFLMSSASMRIWTKFSIFTGAVQFPWRFDIILCIAALPLAAFVLSDASRTARVRFISLSIVILFAATWLAGYGEAIKRYSLPPFPYNSINEADGWFDSWKPLGMNNDSAMRASTGPPARFLAGQGAASILLWSPRHIEVQTDCNGCGPLVINQLYYPEWKAHLASGLQPLSVGVALPQGLLEVQVPPGRQQVRLDLPREFAERVGNWVSVLGVLTCAALCAFGLARRRQRSGPEAVRA